MNQTTEASIQEVAGDAIVPVSDQDLNSTVNSTTNSTVISGVQPGVFQLEILPHHESDDDSDEEDFMSPNNQTKEARRFGASASDPSELECDDDSAVPKNSDELPMIVWLRGDEAWYPEFNLDADAVMAKLGIKRSRLTQISGKELRVGRVRVDRYIKPVYRDEDVESYKAWTRTTASHQKSSAALKDAALALHTQGEQIGQIVADASLGFSKALKEGLLEQLQQTATQSVNALAVETHELKTQISLNFEKSQETFSLSVQQVTGQVLAIDQRLSSVENALTATVLRLAEMSDRQLQFLERQNELSSTLFGLSKEVLDGLENHRQLIFASLQKTNLRQPSKKERKRLPAFAMKSDVSQDAAMMQQTQVKMPRTQAKRPSRRAFKPS
jgi:hypothetical protein